jgi:hypothetical protein
MKRYLTMAAETQDAQGYFVWEAPGQPAVIHLHLDVLDRLSTEVMRGFGAVPKRGAEVGGVLIGSIEPGKDDQPAIVRVEDFEPVDCDYQRGPSYLFTEGGKAVFEDAVQRWQEDPSRPAYAVGYYRSQTRDGMSLAPEDIELLDEFFPDAEDIALLIKPYGTKVSEAGFFVRKDGAFPEASPLEFPFRRRELTGEEPPPHRSMMERRPRPRRREMTDGGEARAMAPTSIEESSRYRDSYAEPEPIRAEPMPTESMRMLAGPAYATTLPTRSRMASRMWIPLSFVFLLFGVALGIFIALSRGPKAASDPQDFALGLSVSKTGDNLSVKWDRHAPAIQAAQSGLIEIDENGKPISRELDTAQLQNGSMTYTNSSNTVKFKLTVFPKPRVSVIETVEWRP